MHIPQTIQATSIAPITGIDATVVHDLVGVSWHILMPYVMLGAGLMAYGQVRLVRGQQALDRQTSKRRKSPKKPQHI